MIERLHRFLVGNQTPASSYWAVRAWLLRGLGFIYFVAFSIIFFQGEALWGSNGLLPIARYVRPLQEHIGSPWLAFQQIPSLFYFFPDSKIKIFGLLGMILSIPLLIGYSNLILLMALWLIQISFVNSGQLFYSYGWETLLLEFTFLMFFFVPVFRLNNSRTPPARVVIWSLRWLLFRLMLGAGLIKLRGDPCWKDLTCLIYHYETQPNPHPGSYFYNLMPPFFHYVGVIFNHFVELVVPFGYFGPAKIRRLAGVITILFQIILISSGNLAWLNWITLIICFCCFDDQFLKWFGNRRPLSSLFAPTFRKAFFQICFYGGFATVIIYLSLGPVKNLIVTDQAMNTSYGTWHFVNSYGAFGAIGKERNAVIISATDSKEIDGTTKWYEYEFFCAPGDITRRPCFITPYHYHLDWQIWFSGMRPELQEEWLLRLSIRLLQGDAEITRLFKSVPFKNPKYIKMDLYRYRFADFKNWPAYWWRRTWKSEYMPPISLESSGVQKYIGTTTDHQ